MTKPILCFDQRSPQTDTPKTTPHLLPCRVHHDGPVEPAQSFWEPRSGQDGTCTAYFRGRRLHGKQAKLPEGYRGVVAVAAAADESSACAGAAQTEVIDLEAESEVAGSMPPAQGSLQVQAGFDELVVWGHETPADGTGDPYLRGVGEWLALAEKIHSSPAPDAPSGQKK